MNLAALAGAVAVLVWVASGLLVGERASKGSSSYDSVAVPTPTESYEPSTPAPQPSSEPENGGRELRGYALAIPEIDGLPSDLQPGAELEVWVAWDPPLTKRPVVEPLVRGVVYERTITALAVGEPPAAVVLVPENKVRDLMYGDRYGSLSVSLVSR